MNISDIELLWSDLQNKTNNIYSDMIRKLMSEVDESALISKKKCVPCPGNKAENPTEMHHHRDHDSWTDDVFKVFPDPAQSPEQGAFVQTTWHKKHISHGFDSYLGLSGLHQNMRN